MSGSPELRALSSQAQALSGLQRQFSEVAPRQLAQCSQVIGLHGGMLSVAVANAAAAAKLRQLVPELVVGLQNKGCEVSGIRIKVQVAFERHAPKVPARELGNTALDALTEFSRSLNESPLKRAIERMRQKN